MSIVHKYFEKTSGFWKCKLCPPDTETRYKISNSGSTTTRKKHLEAAHKIGDVFPGSAKKPKIDFFPQYSHQDEFFENITRYFSEFGIPYSAVESDSFARMLKSYNKSFQVSFLKVNFKLIL